MQLADVVELTESEVRPARLRLELREKRATVRMRHIVVLAEQDQSVMSLKEALRQCEDAKLDSSEL